MTIQEARRSRRTREEAPKKKRKASKARTTKARKTAARKPRRAREAARRSHPMRRRSAPMMMETSKRKASKRKPRRARRVRVESWPGNRAGHAKAARKGWRRRKSAKRSKRVREPSMVAAARKRPRRRRASEHNYATEARRSPRRRRNHTREAARGQRGMQMAQLGVAFVSAGLGFVLADGLDRALATYNPAATEKPKDKFTSDGAGTLANALNVATSPGLARIAVGLAAAAAPAVGAAYAVNPFLRSSLEGMALGAGVSLFKTLWNGFLMPALGPKKDADQKTIQGSSIARLYPAEVAAAINLASKKDATGKTLEGPYPAAGVLSSQPAAGVGAQADVGPFALAADSPYPDASQALRSAAGVQGPGSDYPTTQNVWGTGNGIADQYPTAAQAMGTGEAATGVAAWAPGPPPGHGAGPQVAPHQATPAECGCIGDDNPFLGFIGDEDKDTPFMTV